jgi:hypothetical protein
MSMFYALACSPRICSFASGGFDLPCSGCTVKNRSGSSSLRLHKTITHKAAMQSINRFLYGPTPEEKVRAWQSKLSSESRQLDREMRQVSTEY